MNAEIALASYALADHTAAELAEKRWEDEAQFYSVAAKIFDGVCLLQTCGRAEVLVHGNIAELKAFFTAQNRSGFTFFEGEDVILHLSRLASGIESLIVGEDQILGQMKSALLLAKEMHGADDVIETCISTAVNLGVYVRQNTAISRGAVSIGSAAVSLAENVLGDLSGKKILVVGGGEMGRLVAKSLAEKNLRAIYVTNRTYENAVKIAEEIGGKALHLDQLYSCIALSDVVISCTAAPHEIIKYEPVAALMKKRQWPLDAEPGKLLLIDIANPKDIDPACGNISGITLCGIEDLRGIAEENMKSRMHEAEAAEKIIRNYLPEFVKIIHQTAAGDVLADLYLWAEEIRRREVSRALKRIADGADVPSAIEDMTSSITKKMLDDAAKEIRKAAEEHEPELARKIVDSLIRRA